MSTKYDHEGFWSVDNIYNKLFSYLGSQFVGKNVLSTTTVTSYVWWTCKKPTKSQALMGSPKNQFII